ncbi:Major Facilitator Superfamily [Geosmithia morbida]|uniref:Major Facilitator Superfamily n=1 Tax=Geosmithia morbida TaxID=1094350 RepID=A0A9P5D3L6_9HYPO|nr:Major Facilitator Superfamily [Geosmithia morbida]KAF4122656.1 Major Facilitator Superfamily [Geosmithia morbida]
MRNLTIFWHLPGILFALGSFVGILSDKVSAGILVKIGTALFTLSFVFLAEYGNSFATVLGLQGVLFGVANTLLYYPVVSVATEWFDTKRGLALGLISSGSSIGGIFWPIVVNALDGRWGMNRALLGVALIPLAPLAVSSFIVRERNGGGKVTLRSLSRVKVTVPKCSRRPMLDTASTLLGAVAQSRFILLSVSLFFVYGGFLLPFNYIPMFAEFNGHGGMADALLAICYSGSFVGRISTGALADRFGSFRVLCIMSFGTATLTLCWIFMRTFAGMVAFAVLFGFFSGGLIPLGAVCVADMTSPKDMEHIGFRLGFMMMLCSVSTVGSGPLCGYILQSEGQS